MAGMMEGKVVVVTGAGGGIGREIAIMMAAAGAKVIIADVGASLTGSGASDTPAQQTQQIIRQGGGAAEISTDSVAEWTSAQTHHPGSDRSFRPHRRRGEQRRHPARRHLPSHERG